MNTYQLLLYIRKECRIKIGALGLQHFPGGYYVYTGSARRNMAARLKRHTLREKKLRWHIDYLTSHRDINLLKTKEYTTEECRLNQETGGGVIVKGLGASDCRAGCQSHLKYLGEQLSPELKQRWDV